ADEGPMCAFPQRLRSDGGKACLDRLGMSAKGGQALAQRLERVDAKLAEALALDEDPVLIPVRKQLPTEGELEGAAGFLRRFGHGVAVKHPPRLFSRLVDVDPDVGRQAQPAGAAVDELPPVTVEAPERRAEVGAGPLLAALEPEVPRHEPALKR